MFRSAVARPAAALARRSAAAAVARPAFVRMIGSDGRSEGKVATSQGFGKREKAQEDQFIREQEKAKLAKLREELNKQREQLAKLEAEHDQIAQNLAEEKK